MFRKTIKSLVLFSLMFMVLLAGTSAPMPTTTEPSGVSEVVDYDAIGFVLTHEMLCVLLDAHAFGLDSAGYGAEAQRLWDDLQAAGCDV